MILSKHSISQVSRRRYLPPTAIGLNGLLKSRLLLLTCLGMVFLLLSCGKKSPSQADATAELAASFEGSPAKEDVIKANAAFMEGRYKESLNLLHKVVGSGALTERQKKAMAGIVGQLLKAVHEDPQLSKDIQLHRLMELLVLRTMGET
ncbi:MAG: hypothetical protein HQ580_12780 [Planctomycetes bacterium]|nr:hypothetical protein [Planctomycetota bacterium]